MVVTFTLVMIFNISVCVIAANTFAALFLDIDAIGLIPSLVMLIVAVSAYLLYKIRPKLRFLPIPMLALCFLPIQGIAAAIVMLLPCLYVVLQISLKRFDFGGRKFRDLLRLNVAVVLFLPFILVISEGVEQLYAINYFSYLFIFVVSGICLIRLGNNTKNVYSNPKIIVANLAMVIGVVLILIVISSPPVLTAIGRGIAFITSNVLLPAVIFLVDLLNRLTRRRTHDDLIIEQPYYAEEYTPIVEIPPEPPPPEDVANLPLFLVIILGILAVVTLFLVLRRPISEIRQNIRKRLQNVRKKRYLDEEYESLIVDHVENLHSKKRQPIFAPRDSRLAVRFYYRKYLKLCAAKGKAPDKGDTSEDINAKNEGTFSKPDIDRLRELYIKARYSVQEITREESKEADKLTKSF
jgi:hypothetical protein